MCAFEVFGCSDHLRSIFHFYFYIIVSLVINCRFRLLYVLCAFYCCQDGYISIYLILQNDCLLWRMYFFGSGSAPQLLRGDTPILRGTAQNFEGTASIFRGSAPIFGKLPQIQGEGSRTCLQGNKILPLVP